MSKSCRINQSTPLVFNNFFRTAWRLWGNVGKYSRAGQVSYNNIAHAYCMLDTLGLQTLAQNIYYLLFFHCSHSYTNAPQYYVMFIFFSCYLYLNCSTLKVLLSVLFLSPTYWHPVCRHLSNHDMVVLVGDDASVCCYLNLRRLMSYIYGAPILDVSRSHTTTQHSR